MGGKYCCVVGCYNFNVKIKLFELERKWISYFFFFKDKEWRVKLILVVNRVDVLFNLDIVYICLVYFEDKYLLFYGK